MHFNNTLMQCQRPDMARLQRLGRCCSLSLFTIVCAIMTHSRTTALLLGGRNWVSPFSLCYYIRFRTNQSIYLFFYICRLIIDTIRSLYWVVLCVYEEMIYPCLFSFCWKESRGVWASGTDGWEAIAHAIDDDDTSLSCRPSSSSFGGR